MTPNATPYNPQTRHPTHQIPKSEAPNRLHIKPRNPENPTQNRTAGGDSALGGRGAGYPVQPGHRHLRTGVLSRP
jgi:hypothetical protein